MIKTTLLFLMLGSSSAILQAKESNIVAPASSFKKVEVTSTSKNLSVEPVRQMTQEKAPLVFETSADEVAALQKQIEALKDQLEKIEKEVKDHGKQTQEIKSEQKKIKEARPVVAASAVAAEPLPAKEATPVFDAGYIPVPGTKAAIKFSGLIKLDAIYDGKNNAGDYTLMSNLPYNLQAQYYTYSAAGPANAYNWKKHFQMHGKQTRLNLTSTVKNTSGKDLKGVIEIDFLGNLYFGDAYSNYASSGMSAGGAVSTTYTPRLRLAYINYGNEKENGGRVLLGHYWTNFYDTLETITPTVDFGSLNGPGRRAQARYTHKFDRFEAAISAEMPKADYVTYNNAPSASAFNYVYTGQSTSGNYAKPERPDFVLSLKYKADSGSLVSLSLLNRDLRIKYNNNGTGVARDGRVYKAANYGINLTGKLITIGKSYATAGVIWGKGLGWYIGDINGRSALLDISTTVNGNRMYKAIPATMIYLGYTHMWNDQWKTNFGGSQVRLGTASSNFNRGKNQWYDPGLDKTMTRYVVNTMYSPEPNLQFGLEFMYLKRLSVLKYKGEGNRYQFGATYTF